MTRRTSARLLPLALATVLLTAACASGADSTDDTADGDPSGGPVGSAAPLDPSSPADASSPSNPASPANPSTPANPANTATPDPSTASGPASSAPANPPKDTPPGTQPGAPWHPAPGTSWQWQLGGTVDQSVDAAVYDIDGFENSAAVVAALHAKGRRVVCYINAGSWESFRSDAGDFPPSLLGAGNGWKGEKWLDIRQLDALRPLIAKRFDMCRAKGFDAVEPDLLEAYNNKSGFPLTAADQLAYNRMVAGLAHDRGLGVALKNDLDQVPALVGLFDFSVDEQCAEFNECTKLTPFIQAGKAVLHVEYNLSAQQFCDTTRQLRFSSLVKHLELDAWRQPC